MNTGSRSEERQHGWSSQVICAGNENILPTMVTQAVEHSRPELGALIFAYPHAQYILPAIQIDAYDNIDRFLHNLSLVADMVVDSVQKKYHRIDGPPAVAVATLLRLAGSCP